jgi:hypothetical protein
MVHSGDYEKCRSLGCGSAWGYCKLTFRSNVRLHLQGRRNNASEEMVFTAVTMKNAVFWDVTPCGIIINRRFGETCRLHLQARRNNASDEKCYTVIINPYGAISKKTASLIVTAVKTSNPT